MNDGDVEVSPEDAGIALEVAWELQELKPIHRQVCSLAAQGMKNVDVAKLCGITPEYVYVLLKQPVCRQYIEKITAVTGLRLEAMFEQTVDVIGNVLQHGTHADQLKAARLQLEATKRVGAGSVALTTTDNTTDRLATLAERLTGLLYQARSQSNRNFNDPIDTSFQEVQEDLGVRQLGVSAGN